MFVILGFYKEDITSMNNLNNCNSIQTRKLENYKKNIDKWGGIRKLG